MVKKILGLVLCGGRSSRMGRDKGLMDYEGDTWAGIIYKKLSSLNIPVVVSVNDDQEIYYSKVFRKEILVKDKFDIPGPLNGLLSVHDQFPGDDLFVVGCDLIDMKEEVLQNLSSIYQSSKVPNQNYAYFNEGYFETVCAIYSSSILQEFKNLREKGKIKKLSLQNILENSQTCSVPLPELYKSSFENYNYDEQVRRRNKREN
jgi:molybdopterin-guanine dinucleotide biosynthesis protein A